MNRKITIAGGGLAGLSLGISLRKHDVPVDVLEAGRYPRHRVCGEFLAGITPQLLKELDISDCFRDAHYHSETAWYRNGKVINRYRLPQPAIGISRYVLDQRLVNSLCDNGGTLTEGRRVTDFDKPGLIKASGHRPQNGGMAGLKGHWQEIWMDSDLELHIGHGAYMGFSRVEDGYVNVCGLFNRMAKGSFPSLVERFHETLKLHNLHYLSERLEKASLRKGSLAAVSGLTYGIQSTAMDNSLGDRAGMIPPFTGHGMTMALESANTVLPILLDYATGKCSWELYLQRSKSALDMQFRRRRRIAGIIHPLIINPHWSSLTVFLAKLHLLPFGVLYKLTH
jgi:flavin-dependent dehydrogenase